MTAGALAGWREPDNDLIQTALSRIGDRQHRRVFFDRLQNPRWVAALDTHRVFDTPSETSRDEAGQEFWTPWPQGEYLVRMAPLVPAAVGQIFARVSDSSNPYVHELVLQAALALPSAEAQALVGPIESYLQQGTLLNGEEVVALIEAFANAGSRGPPMLGHGAPPYVLHRRPSGHARQTHPKATGCAGEGSRLVLGAIGMTSCYHGSPRRSTRFWATKSLRSSLFGWRCCRRRQASTTRDRGAI
jgi:hypothetical protein